MNFKLVLSLILAGLAVLFIIQNVAVAEIRFLFWTLSMSRSLLMFFILAIGIVLGWLLHSFMMHRQVKESKDLES
jgi:putative membrane protein